MDDMVEKQRLTRQLEATKRQYRSNITEIENLKKRRVKLVEDIENINSCKNKYVEKNNEMQEETRNKKNEFANTAVIINILKDFQTSFEQIKNTDIESLNKKIQQLEKKIEEIDSRINSLNAENISLNQKIELTYRKIGQIEVKQ